MLERAVAPGQFPSQHYRFACAQRADHALQDLFDLRLTRYPHFIFLPSIWQLRHNLSAYDAAYVALSEKLNAALITRDARLASASPAKVSIELS